MSTLLEQASLVMIPSGYAEDIVYSVIPQSGAGDLSFTRASNGTRINSDGNVEVCPWNLVQYSEDFTNAYWDKDPGATVNPNVATAPNGTTTADRLNYAGGGQAIYKVQTFEGTNTFSVYLKGEGANIGKQIHLEIGNGTGSKNVTLTGEWQRFETDANSATSIAIKRLNSGQADAVLAWGAQLNIGATAKPYFPTTDRLNVPRLTYQNGGGGCPSLLLEKQSTNILTYSEQFDNVVWGVFQSASISANTTISPDGTQNADTLTFSADPSSLIFQGYISLSNTFTISVYAKSSTGKKFCFRNYDGVGVVRSSDFTTTSSWQRFTFTFTSALANVGICNELAGGSGAIQIWGAQLEVGNYATSYIPSTSSSATRVADACFKTGISSLIGQTEGVLFAETIYNGSANTGEFNRIINITDGSSSNFISVSKNNNTDELYIYCQTSAGVQVNSGAISGTSLIGRHKIALAYKSNDFTLFVDGVQKFIDTSASVPTCSRLNIGNLENFFSSTDQLGGSVGESILFPTRLTNSELAQLTGNQNYTINQAYASYGVASESPNCVQP